MREWMELRAGHVWCNRHNKWWKECVCPGDMQAIYTVTQEMIDETKSSRTAYAAALEAILKTLGEYGVREPGRYV